MSKLLLLTIAFGCLFAAPSRSFVASGRAAEPAAGAVERLTATAVTAPKAGLKPTAVTLEIVIDRWSTDAERDRLIETLKNKGSNALLSLMRGLPSIGHLSTTTSKGSSLRFAQSRQTGDGGRRILVATERPTNEDDQRPRFRRTVEYPFSLVDIRIDSSGNGDGRLAYAAQLAHDSKTGALEIGTYATEPVHLTSVRSVRAQ